MITCEEFQLLDEMLQIQVLWMDGVFLLMRKTKRLNIELYSLYNFYVEVFLDKSDNDPLYIKSFEKMKYLDTYLEVINISSVFERIKDH